jgi:phosphonate transport system permease protein
MSNNTDATIMDGLIAARFSQRLRHLFIVALVLAVTVWSAYGTSFSVMKLASGVPQIADLLGRMLPPDAGVLRNIGWPLLQTLEMALVGTALGTVIAVPVAFLAATNTTPHRALGTIVRLLVGALRTVPELIWAMILVTAVGLGPFPGIIALALHTIGGLGKLQYEAIESIAPGPLEAMLAVGAGRTKTILFGVAPLAMPLFLSNALFYWEYNNRASSVLGLVGAGGIGFTLMQSVADFRYPAALTCVRAIVVVLAIIDRLSAVLRQRII